MYSINNLYVIDMEFLFASLCILSLYEFLYIYVYTQTLVREHRELLNPGGRARTQSSHYF